MPVASLPRGGGGGLNLDGWNRLWLGQVDKKTQKKLIFLDKQGRLQDFGRGGGRGVWVIE